MCWVLADTDDDDDPHPSLTHDIGNCFQQTVKVTFSSRAWLAGSLAAAAGSRTSYGELPSAACKYDRAVLQSSLSTAVN